MLDFIEGSLVRADVVEEEIVLQISGIGFRVAVSRRFLDAMPPENSRVTAYVEFLLINEREFKLFGFASDVERQFFRLICRNVRNVGPSTALRILSAGSIPEMKEAVYNSNTGFFSAIKGIGPKTAERLIRELKHCIGDLNIDVVDEDVSGISGVRRDAVKTLSALGLSESAASAKVNTVLEDAVPGISVEELVKRVLKE